MEKSNRNILDCNYIKSKNSSEVIKKIISLTKENMTINDFHRHKEYMDQFVTICKTGFVSF